MANWSLAVLGRLFKSTNGGALVSERVEGVIIGVIVGGSIGIFVGAYKPFRDKEDDVRGCLSGMGYVILPV